MIYKIYLQNLLKSNFKQRSRSRWQPIEAALWGNQATRRRDVRRWNLFIYQDWDDESETRVVTRIIGHTKCTLAKLKVSRRGKPMFMCFCRGDLCNAASPHHLTVPGDKQTNKQTNKLRLWYAREQPNQSALCPFLEKIVKQMSKNKTKQKNT